MDEGPASRSAYVLVFKTEPAKREVGMPVPNYSPVGDVFASYLSVLYGKRFDHHGLIEGIGYFNVPDFTSFNSLCHPLLPHNSHSPRPDYSIPLNLIEFQRLKPLLRGSSLDQEFVRVFQGASKFYLQALQTFERDPEVAYLDLITAGEILSNAKEYEKDTLLDDSTRELLQKIQDGLPDGAKVRKQIQDKLLLIKKRFVKTIVELVDSTFFERSETKDEIARFKLESFENQIAAAYDLRSRYVHTGTPFGSRVSLRLGGDNSEIQVGEPVVGDKQFGKVLALAPTLIGLERVIRYCLLRFAEKHGGYLAPQASS
jgi:hypothetical protein